MDLLHALNNAMRLHRAGELDQAAQHYAAILETQPQHFDAIHLLGVVQSQQGRHDEALHTMQLALKLNPASAEAWLNLGLLYIKLREPEEALTSYDKALAIRPNNAEALHNRGAVLRDLKRPEEALASYERSLEIRPDHAETLYNRGNILRELKRLEKALESYDRALTISPNYADAFNNRGTVLRDLKRFEEALESYDRALLIQPNHRNALNGIADCALNACDWTRVDEISDELIAGVREGKSIVGPFLLFGYVNDPALHWRCARTYIRHRISTRQCPLYKGPLWCHDKVRVAYLSADFRRHPLAYLMAELFELHDRSRFEIIGISFGPDDGSDIRSRLIKSFDQFHDVQVKSDRDVAKLLHDHEIDITIDLMGYTRHARPEILAYRPAPIQVNYLGFPGTMAAEFIDYIIADNIVLPFDQQSFFSEKIVHLPGCYLVRDTTKPVPTFTQTRREAGLPDHGFVFCCFSNNWKITAPIFDVWMRLLRGVKGSVLWLLRDNSSAETNLRAEAIKRGIDPSHLVFADRLPLSEHLARHRLADLFLDTLPYNAHTTASDALWAGLPLVTCRGDTFAGRVGASLLTSIGLSELIASNLAEYESLILRLATDPLFHRFIRQRLEENRLCCPLFNTRRFCCNAESAFQSMLDIARRGEAPRSFTVDIPNSRGIG